MRVNGTAIVVTGEDSLESSDTIVVCQLDTAQVGGVVASLGIVARSGNTAVGSSGIAVPDVDSDCRDGLARVGVDVLDLEENVDSIGPLRLLDVRAHELAGDVVRTVGDLRG